MRQIKLLATILTLLIVAGFPAQALAAEFSFTPATGYVRELEKFTVDLLIDSEDESILQAKAVIAFDPSLVKLTKVERNQEIFSSYPENEQTIDNTNGVLMVTGFTQSGVANLYKTEGAPDVFARLTFEALYDGLAVIDFITVTDNPSFKSVILTDGSPPGNRLELTYNNGRSDKAGVYTIQRGPNSGSSTPKTGLFTSWEIIVAVVALLGSLMVFLGGSTLYGLRAKSRYGKAKTVVFYD